MIKKALIIAAGFGSRLKRDEDDIPKPLRRVAGLPLIERIILSAKKGGISEFHIVVGHQKERIINFLKNKNLGVKIDFIENPDWQKSNGLSVLAAAPVIKENFILLMSDHIFDPETLAKLRQTDIHQNKALLAVDYKTAAIFDMDDATKVLVDQGQIKSIGKEIANYNAIDTGMFLLTPDIFEALRESLKDGDCSLSDGIRHYCEQNVMGTFDIGASYWQDVDTPEALKEAERILFQKCRKNTDGFISRNFNRYVSLFITKYLAKTNLSANQVTALTSMVGIASGYLTIQGDYWHVLWGSVLFKLSSILDGCDGELSKLKLTSSKLGQWLDTISDNSTYLIYFVAIVVGSINREIPHARTLGSLALFGLGMTLLVMFAYLIRNTNSGSLLAIQEDFKNEANQSKVKKILSSLQFMAKRDFFALAFLVFALFNGLAVSLWAMVIGTNIIWLVLLNSKLGLFKSKTPINSVVPSTK